MARSVRGSHWQQGHIGPKGKGGFEPPFFRLVMSRSTFAFRMFWPAVRPCRMVRHPAGPAAGGNAGQVTQNALSLASPLEPGQQAFGQVFAQPLQQAALGRHQAGAAHAGVLAGRVDAAIQSLPATGKLPAGLQAGRGPACRRPDVPEPRPVPCLPAGLRPRSRRCPGAAAGRPALRPARAGRPVQAVRPRYPVPRPPDGSGRRCGAPGRCGPDSQARSPVRCSGWQRAGCRRSGGAGRCPADKNAWARCGRRRSAGASAGPGKWSYGGG